MAHRIIQATAIAAVAAVIAGVPAAVFAAARDRDVFAVAQSTTTSSVPAYTYATYTGSVSPKDGATITAGDSVSVSLAESFPAGATVPASTNGLFSFTPNGNPGSAVTSSYADAGLTNADVTDGNASDGGTLTAAKTLTVGTVGLTLAADRTFKFGVASSAGGTVSIATGTSYLGGSALSSLTVLPVHTGAAAVASLSVSPTAVAQYDHDTRPVYTVTAYDSSGTPVSGAAVKVSINGTYNPAVVGDQTTSVTTWGATGQVSFSIPETKVGANDTLTFFVEPPTSPTTNKVDPSDPQKTVTATFTTPPASISLANSRVSAADSLVHATTAATTVPVTVTVRDSTTSKAPVSGVDVAVEALSSIGGLPAIPRTRGVTGPDGTATVNVPVPAGGAVDGAQLALSAYISGSDLGGSGDLIPGTTQVSFQKPRYFVQYAGSPSVAVSNALAQVQAVAGGTVNIPLHVQDQFGDPGQNLTLRYTIADHVGNAHSRGNTTGATAITTNANGDMTVTYTDQAKNGATKTDTDDVVVSDVFGYLDANGGITLGVSYLASLTANGTNSKWGVYSNYGAGSEANTDPNAAAAGGKPSYTAVVSADPAVVQGRSAHVGYSVLLRSSDNVNLLGQKVTFSAPGAILVDPNHLDADGNPTYGVGTLDVLTGQVGDAAVLVTSTKTGTVTLTATAGGFSHTFNPIAFDPDKAYNLSTVTAPTTVKPGSSVKFTYAVADEFGNAVYGSGPDNVNPNWTYSPGADGILGSVDDGAPVSNLAFAASTGDTTAPGTASAPSALGSNSQFAVTLGTVSNDTGSGSLVVKPTGGWQASDYAPAGAPSSLSSLLVAHTLPATGVSSPFTVAATGPTGQVAITIKVTGKQANKGRADVLTITVGRAAAGAKVSVTGGKKTVRGTVGANGKVTLRIADKTVSKNNTYTIKVGATSATKAGQKKFTIR